MKNKKVKFLHTEYASFRDEIVSFFNEKVLHETSIILDPWSGFASLTPHVELSGKNGFFNDILPVHFVVNKPKSIKYYKELEKNNLLEKNILEKKLLSILSPLNKLKATISNEIYNENVLSFLVTAWEKTNSYEWYIGDLLKAVIVLIVRECANFVKSDSHPNWIKIGGMAQLVNPNEAIREKISKYTIFYNHYYSNSSIDGKQGNVKFINNDALNLKFNFNFDTVFTSPSYRNSTDHYNMFLPELYFLEKVGFKVEKNKLIGTNTVKDYKFDRYNEDLRFISMMSQRTYKFIQKVVSVQSEKSFYYPRLFCRHYTRIFRTMNKLIKNINKPGKIYIIVQSNVHRGNINDMGSFILDFFQTNGLKAEIVKKYDRTHLGKRNLSKKFPVVLDKVPENIVKAEIC